VPTASSTHANYVWVPPRGGLSPCFRCSGLQVRLRQPRQASQDFSIAALRCDKSKGRSGSGQRLHCGPVIRSSPRLEYVTSLARNHRMLERDKILSVLLQPSSDLVTGNDWSDSSGSSWLQGKRERERERKRGEGMISVRVDLAKERIGYEPVRMRSPSSSFMIDEQCSMRRGI
jgi:hypothetical protein